MKYRVLLTLFVYILGSWGLFAQRKTSPSYTSDQAVADTTLRVDSVAQDSIAPADSTKKAGLEAPVDYKAKDSIVMTAGNMAYLFGEGDVKYQQIQLQAENIEMNMDSSLVYAKFGLDSVGDEFGYPLFIDGSDQYESKTMRYNFKSKKGYITDVITQQGEGYVTAGKTKKTETDALNMVGGKYTTCDEHEHPHFYIQMTKAKVRPKKNIVTGPVYLVFEDVPIYPLGLPFCFFPFSDTYSSGILMPTFGDESARGFYLRDGGYYFALSDYMDLALTGEIYTKGSWGLSAKSNYRKRYKYSGSFLASYLVSKYGDKGLPDYSKSKDFKITWTHSQDAKANPYRTFSASVNFATSSYARNQYANQPLTMTPYVQVNAFEPGFDYWGALVHGRTGGWDRLVYGGGSNARLCYTIWSLSDIISFSACSKAPETGWLASICFRFGRPVFCTQWNIDDSTDIDAYLQRFAKSQIFWFSSGTDILPEKLVGFKFEQISTQRQITEGIF